MDSLSQELPPLGEWAATPELIVGAIVAAFTAVSFWQSWYLAVKYERRGLQRGIARSLFNNHVCLFLGCGIVSASALWSALWLKAGGQERPCTVQLALPLISPLPIGVSIFTITRALSNMNEVLKEMKVMPETKSAVARIREKWYLCCWFSFAVSLQLAFGNVIGTFFKKDIFSGSFMSQVDDRLVYFAFLAAISILSKLSSRGILGLVSVVSLVSLLFILSRCIMLYRYYQEEDLTRSNYEWLLNSIFDALSVMVFLLALTLFNMSGSVFYAAYEVSKVRIEAPLDDQKQETDSYALLVSYGAMA